MTSLQDQGERTRQAARDQGLKQHQPQSSTQRKRMIMKNYIPGKFTSISQCSKTIFPRRQMLSEALI